MKTIAITKPTRYHFLNNDHVTWPTTAIIY